MEKETKSFVKWGIIAVLGVVGTIAILGPIASIVTAPGRVVTQTMGTNNILNNYEMFFDLNAAYERRVGDIQGHASMVETAADQVERNRLNVELAGMRQTCRDLAVRYNAASKKLNVSLFKSNNLPYELDMERCSK